MKSYLYGLDLFGQGKVRDTFTIPHFPDLLFIVATDRLSTHNIVHRSLVPGKGMVLNALSIFWAENVLKDIPNHLVVYGMKIYDYLPGERGDYPEDLHLRAVIVKKLDMIPYEFIWRGRLAGSLYGSFYSKEIKNPYEVFIAKGLDKMSLFEPPVFTPTDKSETDDPVSGIKVSNKHPEAVSFTQDVYSEGKKYALERGIEIIDFKAEVGRDREGKLYLADEWLTPDCCRFVRASAIKVGENPKWMDKELFRVYAVNVWDGGEKYPLDFSPNIVAEGTERYRTIFEILAEQSLETFQKKVLEAA